MSRYLPNSEELIRTCTPRVKVSRFLSALVLISVLLPLQNLLAETPKDVRWGGVWLRGNNVDRQKFYPIGQRFALHALTNENSEIAKNYSARLIKSLLNLSKSDGGRIVDRLQNRDLVEASSGRALVLACAINYEFFEKVIEAGQNVVYAEVGFELLVCDFATRSVVFSLPSRLQFKDLWQGEGHINSEIKKIYEERLPKSFMELSKKNWDGGTSFQTVGFGKVDVWDEARKSMPAYFSERPEFFLSSLFASTFSKSADIPIMPFSEGKEVVYTGLVVGALADTQNVTNRNVEAQKEDEFFVLEQPSYTVDLVVPAFKEMKDPSSSAVTSSLHYAFARVIFKGVAGGEVFNEKYDAGVRRLMVKGDKVRPLWLASWDATSKLFGNVAKDVLESKNEAVSSLVSGCRLR